MSMYRSFQLFCILLLIMFVIGCRHSSPPLSNNSVESQKNATKDVAPEPMENEPASVTVVKDGIEYMLASFDYPEKFTPASGDAWHKVKAGTKVDAPDNNIYLDYGIRIRNVSDHPIKVTGTYKIISSDMESAIPCGGIRSPKTRIPKSGYEYSVTLLPNERVQNFGNIAQQDGGPFDGFLAKCEIPTTAKVGSTVNVTYSITDNSGWSFSPPFCDKFLIQ